VHLAWGEAAQEVPVLMNLGPALAVGGACAVLFGASYAAADLTGNKDDGGEAKQPAPPAAPANAAGKSLALTSAPDVPGLKEPPPPPKPEPKPAPAAPSPGPAPAPAPQPQVVSDPSPPPPVVDQAPAEPVAPVPQQPVQPQPTQPSNPAPQPATPTDFYDSGG
jgi:hypothetical protein